MRIRIEERKIDADSDVKELKEGIVTVGRYLKWTLLGQEVLLLISRVSPSSIVILEISPQNVVVGFGPKYFTALQTNPLKGSVAQDF